MAAKSAIHSFLPYTSAQKDAVLVIAEGAAALKTYEAALVKEGFEKAVTSLDAFGAIREGRRVCVAVTPENVKSLYDIAAQYPTGQITMINKEYPETVWANPDYEKGGLAVLIEKKSMIALVNSGFDFRTVTGLTFQG